MYKSTRLFFNRNNQVSAEINIELGNHNDLDVALNDLDKITKKLLEKLPEVVKKS